MGWKPGAGVDQSGQGGDDGSNRLVALRREKVEEITKTINARIKERIDALTNVTK
jgi:hypothetical protein